MKKLIAMTLAAAMLLSLTACGSTAADAAADDPEAETASADASAETPSEKPRSTADGISCVRRKSYKSRANCRIVNGALPRGDLPCPRVSSAITR